MLALLVQIEPKRPEIASLVRAIRDIVVWRGLFLQPWSHTFAFFKSTFCIHHLGSIHHVARAYRTCYERWR